MPQVLRSVLSIFVGVMVIGFLVIALTVLAVHTMHLQSGHPTPAYLAVSTVYSLLAALAGGFAAGRIAGWQPIAHGLVLAVIMVVLNVLSFHHASGTATAQPHWYMLMLEFVAPAMALAGSALAAQQMRTRVA